MSLTLSGFDVVLKKRKGKKKEKDIKIVWNILINIMSQILLALQYTRIYLYCSVFCFSVLELSVTWNCINMKRLSKIVIMFFK